MQLTPHFSLEELIASQTAARLGIDNTPTAEVLANLRKLAGYLETVRAHFDLPLSISSGYRCPALNAAVPGSSKTSAHCFGLAADFTVPGWANLDACREIATCLSGWDQIIYEFGPAGWVHLGLTNLAPRMNTMTTTLRADPNDGPKGERISTPGLVTGE